MVIVPDDQLSLAIGREGQNARLAAKLTGWRIDIKSLTEAAGASLDLLDHPSVDPAVTNDEVLLEKANHILEKKEAGRPITSEDYQTLSRLVAGIEGRIVSSRAESYAEVRRERAEARKRIPAVAWKLPLEELDLPGRIHNLLLDNNIETVGDVLLSLDLGDEIFLDFRGFGDKMLETLKEYVAVYKLPDEEILEEAPAEVIDGEILEEAAEELVEDAASEEVVAAVEEELVEVEAVEEEQAVELVEEMVEEEIVEEESEAIPDIDDLSKSIFERETAPVKKKKKPAVVVATPADRPGEETDEKSDSRRGRSLVFDEKAGEVVVKRKRKSSRSRPDWEEFDADDL